MKINDNDFPSVDPDVLRTIESVYTDEYMDSINVTVIEGKLFIYLKADKERMISDVYEVLSKVAVDPDFDSPVYISFSETGELLFD